MRMPFRTGHKVIVTREEARGVEIARKLGPAWRVMPIGGAISGALIDYAIVVDPIDPKDERERAWWDSCFLTRVEPGAVVVFGNGETLSRNMMPAFACEYARMWDLVRSQRHELHEQGLITNEEYGALVAEETERPGSGSPSRRRLESYDELRHREVKATEWRDAIERAAGVQADAENHTPEWAFELVRAMREAGNQS